MLYTGCPGFQQRLGKGPHFCLNPCSGQSRLDDVEGCVHIGGREALAMKSAPQRLKTVLVSLRLGG